MHQVPKGAMFAIVCLSQFQWQPLSSKIAPVIAKLTLETRSSYKHGPYIVDPEKISFNNNLSGADNS
jgi:hypothetical protein